MSFLDLDQLTPRDLIAQYVIDHRQCGHFLPYDDYLIIDQWLNLCANSDQLLVVLSDVLPKLYEQKREGAPPPSLRVIDRRVTQKLHGLQKRRPSF